VIIRDQKQKHVTGLVESGNMRFSDITEGVGKIVQGVNTTHDVKPGETERQSKKYFGGNGKPLPLVSKKVRKNSDPNTLYNLGLTDG